MIRGDEAGRLRSALHAPHQWNPEVGKVVEAYPRWDTNTWSAACNFSSSGNDVTNLSLCHSIRWDPSFMPLFSAIKNAFDLQYEVAMNTLFAGAKLAEQACFDNWPIFGSILKKRPLPKKKNVSFDDEVEAIDAEPLSSWAVLISDSRLYSNYDSHAVVQGETGRQTTAQGQFERHFQPPEFITDLFGLPGVRVLPNEFFADQRLVIRTWYLHHDFFPRWRVPRFVELGANWHNWQQEIENTWRDMINPADSIHLTTILSELDYDFSARNVLADVVIAQAQHNGRYAGLLIIQETFADRSARSFAVALSLPPLLTGFEIAHAADPLQICSVKDCKFFHQQNQLTVGGLERHRMRNGHLFRALLSPRRIAHIAEAINMDDVSHLMQRHKLVKSRPKVCNEGDSVPDWYHDHTAQGGRDMMRNQWLQEVNYQDAHAGEDLGEESHPSDDPEIHPPNDDDDSRQAVLLFHLDDAPIHAMLDWSDFPSMIREIAYHYGVERENVLDAHEMTVQPSDVPAGAVPLIVQQVQDVPVGAAYVLILVDIEIHGQWMEAHFGIAPVIERRVVPVPALLSRNALLAQAKVFEFCRFEKHRCLVEHNLQPWLLQDPDRRHAAFGDYAKIVLPPSLRCHVATGELLADSRRMTPEIFWGRYYEPSSSAASLIASDHSDVSPSLLDSDDIRAEFGPQSEDDPDEASAMQQPASLPGTRAACSSNEAASSPQNEPQPVCVSTFDPFAGPVWPLWFDQLVRTFGAHSEVEDDIEGPVAYVTTWFLSCSVEMTSEDSRIVRLDNQLQHWVRDIWRMWQDKIDPAFALHYVWVAPTPLPAPYRYTIGHLIAFQHPSPMRVPVLVSLHFQALGSNGIGHAAVVIRRESVPEHLVTVLKLDRVCRGRRCTLHRGVFGRTWHDALHTGEGLRLIIPTPGEPSHRDVHWNQGVSLVFPDAVQDPDVEFSMRIEDYSDFIQSLYQLWKQAARPIPASLERVLEITTWYDC